ncbi:DNA repair protein RadC [Aestuariirhabdus sp. Z084]|uniref:RadC family protein n=1 Tax=Aestuariirhabdus haliotis TaxID=2918751 RepID=UPI00201B41BE|nr:DNA repair protein RadC [Aestuariirhabdus haliotis]MCL6414296.1 DNA repair protein RadC [Aestuariirhabdus haliotis]MCL6418228.1 DNA repair protein RadC [Aestuariirhabdus haliotis]
MAITDWPAMERPREKLLARGASQLSDAELLAIFLRTGITGRSAVDLARDMLQTFGGLRGILEADQRRFCAEKGLGAAKYSQLQAVLEMSRRHLASEIQRGDAITSSEATRHYLLAQLRHHQHEVFACIYLDNQHRILDYEEVFQGTIDSAAVYPREIVKRCLGVNAAAVILAHNHPSGVAEPSTADIQITERLVAALSLMDIRVLDHMVVGDQQVISFAERGLMPIT